MKYFKCVIPTCSFEDRREATMVSSLTWHSFPNRRIHLRQKNKWIEIIRACTGDSHWFPSVGSKICSRHFKEEDFYGKLPKSIKPFAYPTLHLPETPLVNEVISQLRRVPEIKEKEFEERQVQANAMIKGTYCLPEVPIVQSAIPPDNYMEGMDEEASFLSGLILDCDPAELQSELNGSTIPESSATETETEGILFSEEERKMDAGLSSLRSSILLRDGTD